MNEEHKPSTSVSVQQDIEKIEGGEVSGVRANQIFIHNDPQPRVEGDYIKAEVGDNNRKVNIGKNQVVAELSNADGAELIRLLLFERLKRDIDVQAPEDRKHAALERVSELQNTLMSSRPNLTTIEYVKSWFETNIPTLAEAVSAVLNDPN